MRKSIKNLLLFYILIPSVASAQYWNTLGNAIGANDFFGTTNTFDIEFRTDNLPRMYLSTGGNLGINTSTPAHLLDVSGGDINLSTGRVLRIGGNRILANEGTNNLSVGVGAGDANTTGTDNTALGFDAGGANTTGSRNVSIGAEAGDANTTASDNVFVGRQAGTDNTTGFENVFIGTLAGGDNTTAGRGVHIGRNAGRLTTTGDENTYIGFEAGTAGTTAENNTFVGFRAGEDNTASNNVFVGFWAGVNNTTATGNTFLGYRAGRFNTDGAGNTIVGHDAGENITTGDANTFVGNGAGSSLDNSAGNNNNVAIGNGSLSDGNGGCSQGTSLTLLGFGTNACNGTTGLTNAGAIGANAKVEASNALVLGSISGTNGASANANVGIGTTTPAQRLHVQGTARITGSDGTATTVMGRDADGDVNAITVGSGLTLSGNTLSATGGGGGGDWLLVGNAGTTAGTNFIGTTDSEDFVVKTNGTEYLRVIGEATNRGNVGVHTASPTAVLHVIDDASASSNTAIYGYVTNGTISKAVQGYSLLNSGTAGYGGYFSADAGSSGPTTNYGVWTIASGAADNYGIYATYTGSQSTTDCAGYFAGNAYASGMFIDSDSKLKENISDMSGALRVVAALRPVSFEHRTEEFPLMNLQQGLSYGFIAQEVEPLVPGLVTGFKQPGGVDADGVEHAAVDFKALNYIGIIPFLTKAIQEQQAIIEAQEARLLTMETEINNIKQRLGY